MKIGINPDFISIKSDWIELCEDHDKTSGRYIFLYNENLHKYSHVSKFSIRVVRNKTSICYYIPYSQPIDIYIISRTRKNIYIKHFKNDKEIIEKYFPSCTSGYPEIDELVNRLVSLSDAWRKNLYCRISSAESSLKWRYFFRIEYIAKLAYQYKYETSLDLNKVLMKNIGKFTKEYQNYILSIFSKVLDEIGVRTYPFNELLLKNLCIYLSKKGYYSRSGSIFTYELNDWKVSLELEAELGASGKPDILITYSNPEIEFGIAIECKMGGGIGIYKKAIDQCKRYKRLNFIKHVILISMTKIPDNIKAELNSIYDLVLEEVYPGSKGEQEMNIKFKEFLNNIIQRD